MIGCLCIHGFTGDPSEFGPLARYLKDKNDWQISVPVLPGHGKDLQKLKGIKYQQWIDYAEKELKKLLGSCGKVYVIGFFMGGLIAAYLAACYPVHKLVLLSAAAYYIHPKQLSKDFIGVIKDAFKGKVRENELYVRYKPKITGTPVAAVFEFQKLVRATRPFLQKVQVPTLIAQGECDGIVPPKTAEYLYQRIGAPEKKLIVCKECKAFDLPLPRKREAL